MQLPGHKTKIVCTIGPASRDEDMLRELMRAGMNVARLNFSHGTFSEMKENIDRIRKASSHEECICTILADLPGPKIRLGKLKTEPITLSKWDRITLTTEEVVGDQHRIQVKYPQLPKSVKVGGKVFLFDGFIQLEVLEINGNDVVCEVLIGGDIYSNKGVNLPDAELFIDNITERDLSIVDFALKNGIDIFCASFVKGAEDILTIKRHAEEEGFNVRVIAKIERAEAVENIEEILEAADGLMIARGDLGVQMPIEDVPGIQKKLILLANRRGIPVITATQMLVSMTENIRPTRAEASDVANAILDGTDAIMLSEETAMGHYPVQTVEMMVKIAESIENARCSIASLIDHKTLIRGYAESEEPTIEDVISLNAVEAADKMKSRFIVTPTASGSTPRRIARFKPPCWTLAFTRYLAVQRFLNLSYGVFPVRSETESSQWDKYIMEYLKIRSWLKKGDNIVMTQGIAPGVVGGTDSLRIMTF